jgi:hypothetical protein
MISPAAGQRKIIAIAIDLIKPSDQQRLPRSACNDTFLNPDYS